jgi:hypothetical protein
MSEKDCLPVEAEKTHTPNPRLGLTPHPNLPFLSRSTGCGSLPLVVTGIEIERNDLVTHGCGSAAEEETR